MSRTAVLIASMLGWILLAVPPGPASADDETPKAKSEAKQAKKPAAPEATGESDKPAESSPDKEKVDLENLSGPEKELAAKGLTKHDKKFLLDESAAIDKLNQAKSAMTDHQKAVLRYSAIAGQSESLMEMEAQVQALQQRVNATQAQLNSMGSGYGRARQFANQQQAPLRNQMTQDRAAITQINQQIAQAKAKGPKPDEIKAGTAEIDRARQTYLSAVMDLDQLVAPLLAKYHELGKDKDVVAALDALHKETKQTYKLGPSNDLVFASRLVMDLKRNMPRQAKSSKSVSKKKTSAPKSK